MNADTSAQPQSPRRIIILGAGGYLGAALCEFFHANPAYSVTAVSRHAPGHRFFSEHIVADVFSDSWAARVSSPPPFALINCAFDFAAVGEGDVAAKYVGLASNLQSMKTAGPIRLINISSASAYPGCRTDYGREKLYVETLFERLGGISVRPGLIASWRRPGTAMLRLIDITRNSKFFPLLVARGAGFYMCDLEAVLLGLFILLNIRLNKSHTLSFCYRKRLTLGQIERLIEKRYRIRRPRIPVPWLAAYVPLMIKEKLVGKSKIRADSVIDFAYPANSAFGRSAFASIVAAYREELQAAARSADGVDGFYFLEGPQEGAHPTGLCRLKRSLGQEPIAALRQLANT